VESGQSVTLTSASAWTTASSREIASFVLMFE
jgi:hypothetical protein